MKERLRNALPAVIGLALFVGALVVLRRQLHATSWHQLTGIVLATDPRRLVLALVLTALNYAVLTGYDFLAFASIGRPMAPRRIVFASFIAYATANTLGFAMLSGASVRYRFYTRWGVKAEELARIVFSYSVTFWLGLLALGGLALAVSPIPSAHELPAHGLVALVGWLLVLACVAYLVAVSARRGPIRIGRLTIPLPAPWIGFAQLAVSAADWALAATVVYVLVPTSKLSFLTFLGAFLAAQLLALASHVPGGIGVFEGLMLILLKPFVSTAELLPALTVFRAIYYLLPFAVALLLLVTDELHQRRADARRVGTFLGQISEDLAPRVLAVFVFLAGTGLLLSGATPAAPGRLAWLDRFLPLAVIEASHFVGSIAGAALLILSQGLARRLDAAYFTTAIGVALGIVASLLKGADVEEASLLTLLLALLWRARPAFGRRAAFFETRFSAGWIASLVAAVAASVWLGLFAFRHVEYSSEMWWQFELQAEAPRFLRASVGSAIALMLFGVSRLMQHAPHEVEPPTEAELATAGAIIAQQSCTPPYLVYLRDKGVLFDAEKRGFIMYGVQGRTWVSLHDPVGPPECAPELIRAFLERCDDFGGTPVFYEVRKEALHRYADFGLTFVKLGEEARVDLRAFSMDGPPAAKFRQAVRRLAKDGCTFRMVAVEDVGPILDRLESVSSDWLREKSAAEKGFSLGFFSRDYVSRLPVAVVERQCEIVAFANLWPGPDKTELSVDLMRYHRDAPNGVMEALFVHLMGWGRENGYHYFSLGMAPLSGFESSSVASLWNRIGIFLYEHGETFYNFQGLRAYKEKFNPLWEPRYLAYQGGLRLARILSDVSALVAGGYRRILFK
jgi:phosphatidylglycerol lysyltransferase